MSRKRSTSAGRPGSRPRKRLGSDHPGGKALAGTVERSDRVIQMRSRHLVENRSLEAGASQHQDGTALPIPRRGVDSLVQLLTRPRPRP